MIRITVEDTETGETSSRVIEDDYCVICAGRKYVDSTNFYPKAGTTVITIKTAKPEVTVQMP